MWLANLAVFFAADVRARAASYVGRLEIHERRKQALHAHVQGTAEYCVRVLRQGRVLDVACSCPYFDSGAPCKHLWALLVYADRERMFAGAPAPAALVSLNEEAEHEEQSRPGAWRAALARLREGSRAVSPVLETDAELMYILDVSATVASGPGLAVEVASRTRKLDGEWSKPRAFSVGVSMIPGLPDADREIVALVLALAKGREAAWSSGYYEASLPRRATLPHAMSAPLVARMGATGRLFLRLDRDGELTPCAWSSGAYRLRFRVLADERAWVLRVEVERDGVVVDPRERLLITPGGLVFFRDHGARVELPDGAFHWVALVAMHGGALRVRASERDALIDELLRLPAGPIVELPAALSVEERHVAPRPRLVLRSPLHNEHSAELDAELRYDYGGCVIGADDERSRLLATSSRALYIRDRQAESTAEALLPATGLYRAGPRAPRVWKLPPQKLSGAVRALSAAGWRVEADGQLFRTPGKIDVDVSSGVDWFDLNAEVHYGDELRASVPELLAAQRRGGLVRLSDGSFGVLPEEWLAKHRLLGELGSVQGDAIRFRRSQIGLLDALLAALPEARGDEQLAKARAALARFDGVRAQDAPPGFCGALREYQRDGLGWLTFLGELGFGGCLADDMGLGKTVQVLALLAGRRGGKPSIVVVPKSLIFNWRREAGRFAPKLRVLEHHGLGRSLDKLDKVDIVVTTYATLVRDIAELGGIDFDYAILDEAQAIKNARTEAARAVRLLRADHRLVLTGTPVENRLGDLWSLFEFLNPGMLGSSTAFKQLGVAKESSRALVARALRPFILRRTKEAVARDLPAKSEQLLYCELQGAERKKYDELRAYYRATLLGLVEKSGIERAQIHILEALLRLRQAACHPGLLDREQSGETSAKLAALLAQLDEVVAGGHKALVFSQFTTLLAIVKRHLDDANIRYECLDGRTRDRQAKVDRFQSDSECSVFLISLKAGGVGLNLTAAEYVFLLDPWWNPAVESQAIDRTHRIGQSRAVFAYRLIGRDTIEEKVLALQAQKRELAEAIITADNSLLANIGREELELLLS